MKPDFSGTFVLDRAASMLSENAAAMQTAVLRIEHDEPRFACSARFASADDAVEFNFVRFTDGRQSGAGTQDVSCCYWDQDTLVSEDRLGAPPANMVMIWRYELIDHGGRLRAAERMRGHGRDQDNVWEFTRQ